MAYYNVCPNCGSNLDPDEKCDCESVEARKYAISRVFSIKFENDVKCKQEAEKLMEADYGKNTGIKCGTSGN